MRTSCVVIGAGAAGLAVSGALAGVGVEHVVLERNEVADTWQRQRWDSFRLNTPGWMNTMLGPVEPTSFASRDEVVRLLTDRADSLPVQTRTPVTSLERDGSAFVVSTPADRIRTATVVLATGMLNVPKIPALEHRLSPRLHQLPGAAYRSAAQLPDGAVLVVGGGQSGCQIAQDLALAGRQVYLSTSRVGRYPWIYRGRELIGWLVDCGHWDQRPEDLADPAEARAPVPVVGSGGRSLDLRILAGLGVTLLGRLEAADGERVVLANSVADNVAYADDVAAHLTAKADSYIARFAIEAPDAEPEPDTGPIESARISELDLAAAAITCVVWCTGFTGDLSWVHLPILDGHGLPRHDGCSSPVAGLWYVGFPWLTHRKSGILHGLPDDAADVADAVVRYLETPRGTFATMA